MAKIVIFGVADFAQLAHYYLTNDSEHEVVGFCVDPAYMPPNESFDGLPVYSFTDIENTHPPEAYKFFAPLSHRRMNRIRETVYGKIKAKGYELISYVSSRAYVSNNQIGENCFILEDNTLQPFTNIGNNVVLWSGNHIGHHGTIHDHVLFTSHVVMSGHCVIGSYSFLGVNATLRDGITVGEGSLIAMGALVTKDTEPWGVYLGAPARKGPKRSDEVDV